MKMNGLVYKQDVVNIFYNRAETADSDEELILAELEQEVNDLDEVDATQNKNGEWVKARTLMTCSNCGNEFQIKVRGFCNLSRYDFCPCCGSWMKGDAAR